MFALLAADVPCTDHIPSISLAWLGAYSVLCATVGAIRSFHLPSLALVLQQCLHQQRHLIPVLIIVTIMARYQTGLKIAPLKESPACCFPLCPVGHFPIGPITEPSASQTVRPMTSQEFVGSVELMFLQKMLLWWQAMSEQSSIEHTTFLKLVECQWLLSGAESRRKRPRSTCDAIGHPHRHHTPSEEWKKDKAAAESRKTHLS